MRIKIVAGNLAAVLLISLVSYFVVRSQIESTLIAHVDERIEEERELFGRDWRLTLSDFSNQVRLLAQGRQLREVYTALDERGRRDRGYGEATAVSEWFAEPARGWGRAPDLVAVLDGDGRVIAHERDRNRMYGEELAASIESLASVLNEGESVTDFWLRGEGSGNRDSKLLLLSISPIRNAARHVVGALLVAYDLSNGMAQQMTQRLGRDAAFFVDGRVYSHSVDARLAEEIRDYLFSDAMQGIADHVVSGALVATQVRTADIGGDNYAVVVAPLPGGVTTRVGFVLLANRSEAAQQASPTLIILLMGLFGIIAVGAYGFVVGTSFYRPLQAIEDGVLKVINGRTDFRIDLESAEFGGLAYRINQLLNVFTGTPEEDEEGRVSSPPGAMWTPAQEQEVFTSASAATSPAADTIEESGPQKMAADSQLASEAEEAYLSRLFDDYVSAKEAVGEDVSKITYEVFVKRIRANEKGLMRKHACSGVRFQVQTRGSQVNLKPVLIDEAS